MVGFVVVVVVIVVAAAFVVFKWHGKETLVIFRGLKKEPAKQVLKLA